VIVAENDLEVARTNLRLMLSTIRNKLSYRAVEPADRPSIEPVPVNRSASLENALTRRPEIYPRRLPFKINPCNHTTRKINSCPVLTSGRRRADRYRR
jgi:hypothetical protein